MSQLCHTFVDVNSVFNSVNDILTLTARANFDCQLASLINLEFFLV